MSHLRTSGRSGPTGRTRARREQLTVALVVGARPNLVKAAALIRAFAERPRLRTLLIHTGQHYDDAMSGAFFRDLGIQAPRVQLRVGSGTHAVQTARIMTRLEKALEGRRVDRVMVVGDVNSTLAGALVAAKLGIPCDHVEAGLRSGDRGMPEEINRLVTDSIAARLFASEPAGVENLLREGHDPASIHHVGNVMIDSLVRLLPGAAARAAWRDYGLRPRAYAVLTLHRPSNVDQTPRLRRILKGLARVARDVPVVFPVHPRTRRRIGGLGETRGLTILEPLGYGDFLSLMSGSRMAITDSGGIQEETTYLGIPCLTLRDSTERPITVSMGTNTLIGSDVDRLLEKVQEILEGRYKAGAIPPLWDGRASERIAGIVARLT